MQITTTTMQGKTGLQIEAIIREAYEAGERNFTTDLPTNIFDPSSIGSTQIDADGTPYADWGFNVGEWDLVASRVTQNQTTVQIKVIVTYADKYSSKTTEHITKTKDAELFFYNVACDALFTSKLCGGTEVLIERTKGQIRIKCDRLERIFKLHH